MLTKNRFCYWYYRTDYEDNKLPLGSFDLKNLNNAEIMSDFSVGSKANIFFVQVSSWVKKDIIKPGRSYYFSVNQKSELYSWVIYMNFLRVKAIYDDFTSQFGQLSLPLDHEIASLTMGKVLKNKFDPHEVKNSSILVGNMITNHVQSVYLRQWLPEKKQKSELKRHDREKMLTTVSKRTSVLQNLVDRTVIRYYKSIERRK